jgi:DNA-binding LytR/AlgR family response regulator
VNRPTAIVAEDETSQRQRLVRLLRQVWPELDVRAECEDGLAAVEALALHRPDVAFLDIRMPGLSGLAVVAQSIADMHVVFTTAHAEHAVQAFEQGAVDYLLKPVSAERLQAGCDRLRQRLAAGRRGAAGATLDLLRSQRPVRALQWISASIGSTVRMIPLDEVLFFQSSDKYTRVVARQTEAIIRTPLKELLIGLDPDEFWQVHRSVIVRVAAVRAMHAAGGERFELELTGSTERVPVSVAFKSRFRGM